MSIITNKKLLLKMSFVSHQVRSYLVTSGATLWLSSLLLICNNYSLLVASADERVINLRMPEVRPTHDESYLCTGKRLNLSSHEFIVNFQPEASAQKVHHILIYGCGLPGKLVRDTPDYVWECGEMNQKEGDLKEATPYDHGPTCAPGSKMTILFGWALDAPAIELPPHVGFKIGGGGSKIHYLVLQVHYGNIQPFRDDPDMVDSSGILLHTVFGPNNGITKHAGIHVFLSYGYVPIGVSRHSMECTFSEDKVLHPFRFRTHTHKLGLKVAGYKRPRDNPQLPILIGEHDPQKPQMFYPVNDTSLTLTKGDSVYAYCDYNNTRDEIVYIGATNNDEMCNFYLMYWIEGDQELEEQDCFQYNPHS